MSNCSDDQTGSIYRDLRRMASEIASTYPRLDFYPDHEEQVSVSSEFFDSDEMVRGLREVVAGKIEDDFGHGMAHADKVALDAGVLVMIESGCTSLNGNEMRHQVRLAQCAGLLHDIVRKEEHHARKGAEAAKVVLASFSLAGPDVEDICLAIKNHEAFSANDKSATRRGALLSDCLYDSDKFRFGPENFTKTVWDMVAFAHIPLGRFMSLYPRGMSFLKKIRQTFRTETGRAYGPQFIDQGLAIGEDLYRYIRMTYKDIL